MARIAYVKAWGLWSHWESIFEFNPGLTVITGPNGSGKSSIIRVMRWIATGEFPGDEPLFKLTDDVTKEIIRQTDEGRAEIGLDDGTVITKTRRKGKTTYTHSAYAEPWEKAEVPQEVKDALGIEEYVFGDFKAYLNFAFQLEAPFLISESPSVGAKVLGKLAGTEVIDLAIAEAGKRIFKVRDEKRIAEKEIERISGDLLSYQDIDDIRQQLQACEYLMVNVNTAAARKDNMTQCINTYDAVVDKLAAIKIELGAYSTLVLVDEILAKVLEYQARYDTLVTVAGQHDTVDRNIQELTDQLTLYKGVDIAGKQIPILEQMDRKLADLYSLCDNYTIYTAKIQESEGVLEGLQKLDVAAADLTILIGKQAKLDKLRDLAAMHTISRSHLRTLIYELQAYTTLEDTNLILDKLSDKQIRLDALQQLNKDYTVRTQVVNMAARDLTAATVGLDAAKAEITEAWEAAGGICPLCDQPVSNHTH